MFPHDAAFWMNHFGAKKTGSHFAEQPHPRANRIRFDLAAVKIEEAHEEDATAVLHLAHELPPRTIHDFAMDDDALNLHYSAFGHIPDEIKVRFIFIAQR